MNLSNDEKELAIVYNFADKFATIHITSSSKEKLFRKLDQFLTKYPNEYKLLSEEKDENGVVFYRRITCPKNLAIGLRAPKKKREISEERHLQNIERGKKLAESKRKD